MYLFVKQDIAIRQLKVGDISNSSVLQIGSSGMIHTVSNFYNTEPAPEPDSPTATPLLVPLASPSV